MIVSGLTGIPSWCCPQTHVHRPYLIGRQVSFSAGFKPKEMRQLSCVERQRYNPQKTNSIRCAMDASYGDMETDSDAIFTRINVQDPYRRLGVGREASEYELQSARKFLIHKYNWHKPSVDAIESAHDKIIMEKLYERKNPKVDVNKKIRELTQSKFVKAIVSRFRNPSTKVIIKTSVAFLALGVLTLLFPTDEGPTFQVAMSLFATIFFLHERLADNFQPFLYGAGAFIVAWLLGTFLMVYVIPPIPILEGAFRSFEMTSALISYMVLWASATYLT